MTPDARLCRAVQRHLDRAGRVEGGALSPPLHDHVAQCAACDRLLAAARLVSATVAVLAEPMEPPADFAGRVCRALAQTGSRPTGWSAEIGRMAWALVPAFGAVVLALFLWVPVERESALPDWLAMGPLTPSEALILQPAPPSIDVVVTTLLTAEDP